MSVDPADQYNIYVGQWTNWSKGQTYGVTLTLGRRDANLLIAFVAFFVAAVGQRFWRILCLLAHYLYSSPEPQDSLHYQRQAVLRNVSNPETGVFRLLEIALAWRKTGRHPFRRLSLLLLASLACVSCFTIASGFSSSISTSMGDEVLLSGANCHTLNPAAFISQTTESSQTHYGPQNSRRLQNAANYAQQCYQRGNSTLLGCGTFPTMRLPTIVYTNASCPFSDALCKSQDSNLILDSLIDSHEHLGINARLGERFQWRQVLHCAPLVTEGYKSQFTSASNRTYTDYYYGEFLFPGQEQNYTHTFINTAGPASDGYQDYTLASRLAYYHKGQILGPSTFNPIPEFEPADADILLFFLSAGNIMFTSEVHDPWYNATTLGPLQYTSETYDGDAGATPADLSGTQSYFQNEAASPLACKSQMQFCNPSLPGGSQCGALRSMMDSTDDAVETVFGGSAEAASRLNWFGLAVSAGFIADIVRALGSHSLASRDSLSGGLQGRLPDNQWMIDVQHWHSIALASLQASVISVVVGPTDADAQMYYTLAPNSTEEHAMCDSQKILTTAYVSFSVFGIAFIFALGGVIILTSMVLDPLLTAMRKWSGFRPYQQLEWRTNDILHLQRMAYEEIGVGTWSGAAEFVPVTRPEDKLVPLDLENPEHPIMMLPLKLGNGAEKDGDARSSKKLTIAAVHSVDSQQPTTPTNVGAEDAETAASDTDTTHVSPVAVSVNTDNQPAGLGEVSPTEGEVSVDPMESDHLGRQSGAE